MHRLYIIGDIDYEAYEKFSKELRVLELKGIKKAELEIVSEGGSAESGLAFYGRIISSKVKLTTIGHGVIQSAATLVFAACSLRIATSECMFMLHNSEEEKLTGDYRKLKKKADILYDSEVIWAQLLGRRSKKSENFWRDLGNAETYFLAHKALEYGLVDKVIGQKVLV